VRRKYRTSFKNKQAKQKEYRNQCNARVDEWLPKENDQTKYKRYEGEIRMECAEIEFF
jgi:hypothetical protein